MPHDDDLHESPLSPADDERIRRLLADARHTEPMPQEVADRLDEVIASLSADRAESARPGVMRAATPAPVVELAARRRRTAANLLIAAAAVVAVGVGISQVLPDGLGGGADTASQETAEDSGAGSDAEAGGAGGPAVVSPDEAPTDRAIVKVRAKRFGADVRAVQRRALADGLGESGQEFMGGADCLTSDVGAGTKVPASYDGTPAVVVLRVPSGDVQVVDLYLCGDTEPRRSITLTIP